MRVLIEQWRLTIWLVGLPLLLGGVGHLLVFGLIRNITRRSKNVIDDLLVRHCYRPFQWTIVVFVIRLGLPTIFSGEIPTSVSHILSLFLIGVVSWLLIKVVYVLEDLVTSRFEIGVRDNLRARKIHTQLRVLKRIVIITVGIVALASMLMTFPKVRQLGTAILASAGIIGIVVGMAAQRTIGAFIAGLQIAFTQPIRVDDVVIVENEWGRIEEITLTYVVVRIWDLRRLIVPITYFIEKPFQNWTRVTADILGTVFLYLDYTVDLDAVRQELQRLFKRIGILGRQGLRTAGYEYVRAYRRGPGVDERCGCFSGVEPSLPCQRKTGRFYQDEIPAGPAEGQGGIRSTQNEYKMIALGICE